LAIGAIGTVNQLKADGKLVEARKELRERYEPEAAAFFKAVGAFSDLQQRSASAARREMSSLAARSIRLELIIGLCILAGVGAMSVVLVRHVRHVLGQVSGYAVLVAAGDLTGHMV